MSKEYERGPLYISFTSYAPHVTHRQFAVGISKYGRSTVCLWFALWWCEINVAFLRWKTRVLR